MRKMTAAEARGMKFEKSGDNVWTSINNSYVIRKTAGVFVVKDGYGRDLDVAVTFRGAKVLAVGHLLSH